MKKVFLFDVETTGLSKHKNDIVQLSGLIEVGGVVKEKFNYRCKPVSIENVSVEALNVIGFSLDELMEFPSQQTVYRQLLQILARYCDKYDRNDKFYLAGYNVQFDIGFLQEFFKRQGDKWYGSWFNHKYIDPLRILHWMELRGKIDLDSYKLENVCQHYGIKIQAHDAMSDIEATYELYKKLNERFV